MNPTRIHEDSGLISAPGQCVKDPELLWLWCRLAATALILPLAWELPYAAGAALKRPQKKKKRLVKLNVKPKTIKLLKENIGKENLCKLGLGKKFF